MARVQSVRPSSRARAASQHRGAERKRPAPKSVFEEIRDTKKLKKQLTFNLAPPPGYTFIPAGDPMLTNKCKRTAKEVDSPVYVVSMSSATKTELSQEVGIIGYHFESTVVEQACFQLGVTLTESGRVAQSSLAALNEDLVQHQSKPRGKPPRQRQAEGKFDISLPQETIDQHAESAITDLFPNIPRADLRAIILRSFQKGRNLVGTSGDLTLARRAHLAVVAHIRHTHTNYDNLLRQMPWSEARMQVEATTLDNIVQWRGKDDNDEDLTEELFREVFIISDDEDDESDVEEITPQQAGNNLPSTTALDHTLHGFGHTSTANIHTRPLDLSADPIALDDSSMAYQTSSINPFAKRRVPREVKSAKVKTGRHQRWQNALNRSKGAQPNHQPLSNPHTTGFEADGAAPENPFGGFRAPNRGALSVNQVAYPAAYPAGGPSARKELEIAPHNGQPDIILLRSADKAPRKPPTLSDRSRPEALNLSSDEYHPETRSRNHVILPSVEDENQNDSFEFDASRFDVSRPSDSDGHDAFVLRSGDGVRLDRYGLASERDRQVVRRVGQAPLQHHHESGAPISDARSHQIEQTHGLDGEFARSDGIASSSHQSALHASVNLTTARGGHIPSEPSTLKHDIHRVPRAAPALLVDPKSYPYHKTVGSIRVRSPVQGIVRRSGRLMSTQDLTESAYMRSQPTSYMAPVQGQGSWNPMQDITGMGNDHTSRKDQSRFQASYAPASTVPVVSQHHYVEGRPAQPLHAYEDLSYQSHQQRLGATSTSSLRGAGPSISTSRRQQYPAASNHSQPMGDIVLLKKADERGPLRHKPPRHPGSQNSPSCIPLHISGPVAVSHNDHQRREGGRDFIVID